MLQFDGNSTHQQIFSKHRFVLSFVLRAIFKLAPGYFCYRSKTRIFHDCISVSYAHCCALFHNFSKYQEAKRHAREDSGVCVCRSLPAVSPQPGSVLGTGVKTV